MVEVMVDHSQGDGRGLEGWVLKGSGGPSEQISVTSHAREDAMELQEKDVLLVHTRFSLSSYKILTLL